MQQSCIYDEQVFLTQTALDISVRVNSFVFRFGAIDVCGPKPKVAPCFCHSFYGPRAFHSSHKLKWEKRGPKPRVQASKTVMKRYV